MTAAPRSRPKFAHAIRTAAKALRSAGFEVEPFRPEGLEEARQLWKKFFVKIGGMLIARCSTGREHDREPDAEAVCRMVRGRTRTQRPSRLLDAWISRDLLRAKFLAQMRRYPILLCPGRRDSRLPPSANAVGPSTAKRSTISTPGATPNGSICWAIPAAVVPVSHRVRRPAHRRADRRAPLGRRAGA